jgi:hypothetical protein
MNNNERDLLLAKERIDDANGIEEVVFIEKSMLKGTKSLLILSILLSVGFLWAGVGSHVGSPVGLLFIIISVYLIFIWYKRNEFNKQLRSYTAHRIEVILSVNKPLD